MANLTPVDSTTTLTISTGDRVYVASDVSLITTGSSIATNIFNYGTSIAVDGTLVSFTTNTIVQESSTNAPSSLVVGETGVVRTLSPFNSALYLIGNSSNFQNYGEISGAIGAWISDGSGAYVENHGAILGRNVSSSGQGLFFVSMADATLNNTGTITGWVGVGFLSGSGTILNSGSIIGLSDSAIDGVDALLTGLLIRNSGLLSAPDTAVIGSGGGGPAV